MKTKLSPVFKEFKKEVEDNLMSYSTSNQNMENPL